METNYLPALHDSDISTKIDLLREAGQDFHRRGWSLATSSNYSIVIDRSPLTLLMTASGKDKGKLAPADFVLVDSQSKVLKAAHESGSTESLRPSAEAALHVVLAEDFGAGSILHTHSVWATILSEKHKAQGSLTISGLEMLKALNGIKTHDASVTIPIFENNQDMDELAALVKKKKDSISHAFLVQGHGLYTWGTTYEEAKRQVEAIEFLLEVYGRQGGLA